MDRTEGVKIGSAMSIQPTISYDILDKVEKDGTLVVSYAKPFDASNIVLNQRRKVNGEFVTEQLPCFAINFKLSKQPDTHKTKYCTMIFRNTTIEEMTAELTEARTNPSVPLNKAKALYSMIIENNGWTTSNFIERLSSGDEFTFAQYKRDAHQLNFISEQYWLDKLADRTSSESDSSV